MMINEKYFLCKYIWDAQSNFNSILNICHFAIEFRCAYTQNVEDRMNDNKKNQHKRW